jgi:hypothetical protein
MKDVTFFLKLVGLTIVVVVLSQIHVGDRSVEAHAMNWVQDSAMAQPLNGVANGAARMIRDVTGKVHSAIERTRGKRKNGDKKPSRAFQWFRRGEPDTNDEVSRD